MPRVVVFSFISDIELLLVKYNMQECLLQKLDRQDSFQCAVSTMRRTAVARLSLYR
jgi:hypothetical protein